MKNKQFENNFYIHEMNETLSEERVIGQTIGIINQTFNNQTLSNFINHAIDLDLIQQSKRI